MAGKGAAKETGEDASEHARISYIARIPLLYTGLAH
jgi:hypothetical protein